MYFFQSLEQVPSERLLCSFNKIESFRETPCYLVPEGEKVRILSPALLLGLFC